MYRLSDEEKRELEQRELEKRRKGVVPIWRTRSREEYTPDSMETSHIVNALRFMYRRACEDVSPKLRSIHRARNLYAWQIIFHPILVARGVKLDDVYGMRPSHGGTDWEAEDLHDMSVDATTQRVLIDFTEEIGYEYK